MNLKDNHSTVLDISEVIAVSAPPSTENFHPLGVATRHNGNFTFNYEDRSFRDAAYVTIGVVINKRQDPAGPLT